MWQTFRTSRHATAHAHATAMPPSLLHCRPLSLAAPPLLSPQTPHAAPCHTTAAPHLLYCRALSLPPMSYPFPVVALIYVNLRQEVASEDGYKRLMANQMLTKFEKYWSEFSVTLAITVVLDPRYKLRLVKYYYMKIYGADSEEYNNVYNKLIKLFMEYSTPTTSSSTVVRLQEDPDWEKEFLAFDGVDSDAQKTQLELYLDEPKYVEKNTTFDILSFWKGNEFRYPEVAAMAHDILSIPISTITSESTFSVGGRVIDQYRSSLKPDIVEALICTRDWLYRE